MPVGRKAIFKEASVECLVSHMNGKVYGAKGDDALPGLLVMDAYADVKGLAVHYVGALARKFPTVVFLTISPGMTAGTNILNHESVPGLIRFAMSSMGGMMLATRVSHSLEKGAARYVDGLARRAACADAGASGKFYGSPKGVRITGALVDQAPFDKTIGDEAFEDAAYAAIHRFL
jgi:hypothetical protein